MEKERHEVYERIPWETLESKGGDKQWLYVGLAGAVALGALAYSFMKSQPSQVAVAPASVATTAPVPSSAAVVSPTTMASPIVVSEADLYAVDEERLIDSASAHAEWFAVEYFSIDGSEESRNTLSALIPEGVPLPEAPDGIQVFVDWVGTRSVSQAGPLTYEVDVAVRSLVSSPQGGFIRQPTRHVRVEVQLGDDGDPMVVAAPILLGDQEPSRASAELVEIPAVVADRVPEGSAIVGGQMMPDGRWRVVAMVPGVDGVTRPVTLVLP